MALTAEERAAINRQNASKSTGPKTDAGKASSRRNALKHGLRAEALALPNEDPAAVAARADAWNDYYRPQSPAAHHMVNACVDATLLSDRCRTYHEAALAKQVRDADHAWEVEREEAVEALVEMLRTDPATATRGLARTGHGCRRLIGAWERLLKALDGDGCWTGPECEEAIRLQGFHPEPDTLRGCPEAWIIRLFDVLSDREPSEDAIAWHFHDDRVPDLYFSQYSPASLPSRDESRQRLRATAEGHLARARALEAAHRESRDDPDRAEAADRALILHDVPSARLFLRYHAEARTAFHRAYGSLVKALERDAAADAEPSLSPIEADRPTPDRPPTDAGSISPDEADPDARSGEIGDSGNTPGADPAPEESTPAVATRARPARKARPEGEPVGTLLLKLLAASQPAPDA